MRKLTSFFRGKVKAAKWYIRLAVTGLMGYGIYCAVVICADLAHDLLANHTLGAVATAILAVNVFVSYPTLAIGFKNLKSWGEKMFTEPSAQKKSPVMASAATVSAAEPVREQTLADVADEFAQSIASVDDEELHAEDIEFFYQELFRDEEELHEEGL